MMLPVSSPGFGLLDEIFRDPFFSGAERRMPTMKTDVREKDGEYIMDVDLPGFAKENVQAELRNGYLTVTARTEDTKDEKDNEGNYIRRERSSGSCSRTFYVGESIGEEDIKASFKDGTLHLTVPKEEKKRPEEQKKLIAIE